MSQVPFPVEAVGEWTVFRPFTAPGMFAHRHIQADGLLKFPDYAGGDMTPEQRLEALERAVTLRRPLTALVVFLNVVALEDLIRDLGARLADIGDLSTILPRIDRLRLVSKAPNPANPSARLDKEPVSYTDFHSVIALYREVIGVEPIPAADIPRLYDLALVRHTVAHHGAIIRAIDVPRFQYYAVTAGQLINPPIPFVKETCSYLYKIGSGFTEAIRRKIMTDVMPTLDRAWTTCPPKLLINLIECFNYFGKVVTSSGPSLTSIQSIDDVMTTMKDESERVKQQLLGLCIEDLKAEYASAPAAP